MDTRHRVKSLSLRYKWMLVIAYFYFESSWGTPINPNGPNPYVSPTSSSPTFSSSFLTSPTVPHTMNVSPSPSWQGSAFASLNKNVAAPAVAPTSCLKVRHMFDRQSIIERNRRGGSTTAWVWQVKDEILQRCSSGLNPAMVKRDNDLFKVFCFF